MNSVALLHQPLDILACKQAVLTPATGGVVMFEGAVRNATHGRGVQHLIFEAYEPMAKAEMKKILDHAEEKWQLQGAIMHHRLGVVPIGEAAVVIVCTALHRKEAFEACQYCIDTLKETVPIWKKEVFVDGETWVSAHP